MQIDFPITRPRGIAGEMADATSSVRISMSSEQKIPFGSLVIYTDSQSCSVPSKPEELAKPLGIALRQLHIDEYAPKTFITVMRQGRVWVNAQEVLAPGDPVFLKFTSKGLIFTGNADKNAPLKGAVFLEAQAEGLVPIEINFLGGR